MTHDITPKATQTHARGRGLIGHGERTSRAAFKNSALNSSSAAAAARAARARSSAICSSRFARPRLIAASLRASGVVPLRGGDDASTASRRRQKNGLKPWRTPRDAPLVDVELAGAVRVEVVQRLLEARGHEQKLQVLLAARLQEVDHVLRTARSVKRSLDDPAPPHTKHTKTAVPRSPRKLKGARS